jgi:hypothetical protein
VFEHEGVQDKLRLTFLSIEDMMIVIWSQRLLEKLVEDFAADHDLSPLVLGPPARRVTSQKLLVALARQVQLEPICSTVAGLPHSEAAAEAGTGLS